LLKTIRRLFPWSVHWRGVLIESVVFLGAYVAWVAFRPPETPSRWLIGSLSVLAPAVTTVILIGLLITRIPSQSQRSWRLFRWSLVFWAVGMVLRSFYELRQGVQLTTLWVADIASFLFYPFLFLALLFHPFENRYGPSYFRFLLDAVITSGVVATLCWLFLAQPATPLSLSGLTLLFYPIADLILLMIVINVMLANPKSREMLFFWGMGLATFLFSDYIFSLLTPVGGYRSGGLESLGWTLGGLIFTFGVTVKAELPKYGSIDKKPTFDLGTRIQNILPVTFVLALGWFVFADHQLNGRWSTVGLWASAFLAALLIARIGVQAGEVELHQYWQLFDSLAEPAFLCDGTGKIVLGNPALANVLGIQDEKRMKGKRLGEIFDDQTLPADLLRMATRQSKSLEVTLRPHKTPYWLTLSPIISENRRVLLAGAAQDLSEQKSQQAIIQDAYDELRTVSTRLEELNIDLERKVEERTSTLEEAYRKLEEQHKILQGLDQLKSDFVSMVSHELRTPLTSVNGGLELLLKQKDRSAADIVTLNLIKNEIHRLTIFVENILNLSAIEAGRINIHCAPVSLPVVLESACAQFQTIAGADRIQVHLPDDLPQLLADKVVIESILIHLMDNALKYAPTSPVWVEAIRRRGKVRIQVTDRGDGIPKGKQQLLFQRFQRLDARDSQSVYGYGLGLYLSQKMLQAMQGTLRFETPAEGGARFYFYLKEAK
jgi:signal transduction histidine kinase